MVAAAFRWRWHSIVDQNAAKNNLSSMQDVNITALGGSAPLAAARDSGGRRASLARCTEGSCSKTSYPACEPFFMTPIH